MFIKAESSVSSAENGAATRLPMIEPMNMIGTVATNSLMNVPGDMSNRLVANLGTLRNTSSDRGMAIAYNGRLLSSRSTPFGMLSLFFDSETPTITKNVPTIHTPMMSVSAQPTME